MYNNIIGLISTFFIFLMVVGAVGAKEYTHMPLKQSDYHYVSSHDKYCNVVNYVKVCGSLELLNTELSRLGYPSDFVKNEVIVRLGRKLSLNPSALSEAYYVLSTDHPLSKQWNRHKNDVKKNRLNDVFKDKRVKLAFYELFPDFPNIEEGEVWAEVSLSSNGNIDTKINNNIRKICDLVSQDIPINTCSYLYLPEYLSMYDGMLSRWVNSYLTNERLNGIDDSGIYVVKDNNTNKFSPNVDRAGGLYLIESDLIKFSNDLKKIDWLLRHESSHLNYFNNDIENVGMINAYDRYSQESMPGSIDVWGSVKDSLITFSKYATSLESLIDLHAINDLGDESYVASYIDSLSKYAAGEKQRRELALLAAEYKSGGGDLMDISAYVLFRGYFSNLELGMRFSRDPLLEKLYKDQLFPMVNIKPKSRNNSLLEKYSEKHINLMKKEMLENIMTLISGGLSYLPEEQKNDPEIIKQQEESMKLHKDIYDSIDGVKSIFSK